ncbi:type IV pilus twitching motility protein PilT [Anaerolentibacter hominis]|uniref:type IV pilus twitching motility protein PilT n=1 Tax=Anaerolentibacter hominis TaxID=3079009 RepID=UPI0031B882C6
MEFDLKEILTEAVKRRASDIHISVGIPPKVRVNGTLLPLNLPVLEPESTKALAESVMNDRQKQILEEKGEVDFSFGMQGLGRCRANIFKQKSMISAVFRLISDVVPTVQELNLPPTVADLYKKRSGLVLVTGPTGSGKSTTLASLVGRINSTLNQHIITLEDPIEYVHRHEKSIVNQREMGMDSAGYAPALRAALREDPDVILVGEMRDLETISTAITAAETGHLVFSTLHTIGAAPTIDRIIDVFPPSQQQQIRIQLGMVLEAVISQRLIPTADGTGRVAAFEVMLATPAVRNLIREGKTYQIPNALQTGRKLGMQTLDDAIYELVMGGVISRKDALANCMDIEAMERKILI